MTFSYLKVGDSIAVVTAYSLSKHVAIGTVSKITATQIHVSNEKFRRDDGAAIGQKTSNRRFIVPVSSPVVFDCFASKVSDRVKFDLQRHDSSFAGRAGIIRSLVEMRDQLDSAIELVGSDEKLIEFGSNS